MIKYLVAIVLPDELSEQIRQVQLAYKSSGWNILIEPHITLLPPSLALLSEDDAARVLDNVRKEFNAFDLEVTGVARFKNKSNTVFVSVSESEPLRRLYDNLVQLAPSFSALDVEILKHRPFAPHITLSNKLHDVLAEQIISQLGEENLRFSFECNNFVLFKKADTDSTWKRAKTFHF